MTRKQPKNLDLLAEHGTRLRYTQACDCVDCRSAHAAYYREYRANKGKDYVRDCNLKNSHGISLEKYNAMLLAQNGVCAACKGPETRKNQFGVVSMAVDHHHETGRIRGILCMMCNRALGFLQDDPATVAGLLSYIRENYTKRVYTAGPMRNIPLFNFPAFDEASTTLRKQGWSVVSPADLDRKHGFNGDSDEGLTEEFYNEAMKRDIVALLTVDAIALLPGWEASEGANVELAVAKAIGLELFFYKEGELIPYE